MTSITKPLLSIDFRERSLKNMDILNEFSEYFNFNFMHLPVGDYIIDGKISIERKTLSDFVQLIKNGRIFKQAFGMADHPGPSMLLTVPVWPENCY